MNQARLTVLSGPTAVGKGTVVTRLIQLHPEICVSISVTTRPPRPGEILRNYSLVGKARARLGFEARVQLGEGIRTTYDW